jgi:hypothetical protein
MTGLIGDVEPPLQAKVEQLTNAAQTNMRARDPKRDMGPPTLCVMKPRPTAFGALTLLFDETAS